MKIEAFIDNKTFVRFTLFDVFGRRKMWRAPVTFTMILGTSAAICFYMNHVDGAVFLGTVLMIVALGMSLTYFASFFLQLRKQVKQLNIKTPHLFYTLELTRDADGIRVENEKEKAKYTWKQVHHVYRDAEATYLFITPQRGFILPHDYAQGDTDELWELLRAMLTDARCTRLKKAK